MSTLITRAGKGAPLTHDEMDGNLEALNRDKLEDPALTPLRQADAALGADLGQQQGELATLTGRVDGLTQTVGGLQPLAEKGVPSGYAPLDAGGKVPLAHLPAQVADSANKGWFASADALRAAYPGAASGDYAIVGMTDSMWVWDADGVDWADTDRRGQVERVNGKTGDVQLAARDVPFDAPPGMTATDVQTAIEALWARAPDVQEFTASGTWIKPAGARTARIILIAAGAGGQGGGKQATGLSSGGSSGGGDGIVDVVVPAHWLADSAAIVIGVRGAGGAGRATEGPGLAGGVGGDCVFTAGMRFRARGGDTATTASNGDRSAGTLDGQLGVAGAGAFAWSYAAQRGDNWRRGSTAGNPGGGINASGSLLNPPVNPAQQTRLCAGIVNGNWDAVTPTGPSAFLYGGRAGLGGSAALDDSCTDGGAGEGYGAGGGGGGATRNGAQSGRGGDGAPGLVVVITYR